MVGFREMRLVDVYDESSAVAVLWELQVERSKEDDPNINISHRVLPPRSKHKAFFNNRPFAHWYLIEVEGSWAGYVSVTRRNEIGVMLFRAYRGAGLGPEAVKMLIEMVKPLPAIPSNRSGHFLANINPGNARSIHLFEKLGFEHIQNTYELRP